MSHDARDKICKSAGALLELLGQVVDETAAEKKIRYSPSDHRRAKTEADRLLARQAIEAAAGLAATALCDLNRIADAAEALARAATILAMPPAELGGPLDLDSIRQAAEELGARDTPDEVADAESRRQACEGE